MILTKVQLASRLTLESPQETVQIKENITNA